MRESTENSEFALKADGVSKTFGKGDNAVSVLKDFSYTLKHGAFEALMGPSGSGKSTFLHIAAGLLSCDEGCVEINGKKITSISDSASSKLRRRQVGVIFQEFNLVSSLRVADNIILPQKLDGGRIDYERLNVLLNRLGLGEKSHRYPAELSGGERQRVAIARALYMKPAVILADEPTGNLDLAAAKKFRTLLAELNNEEKVAILLVTHDPMVASVAHKVNFLKNGKLCDEIEAGNNPDLVAKKYLEVCQ